MTARRLGRGPLEVSPIGLGCWQFSGGRSFAGAFWGALAPDTMDAIVRAALDGGVDWFDTAEIYGNGRSERALAHALAAAGRRDGDVTVATKWWPVLRTARSIGATFAQRERALDGFTVGLHQVHQPFSFSSVEAQMDAMAALVAAGRVRAVGVSNFSAAWMRRAHARLARHGIALATNQVRYSLARRTIERDGTLAAARELGVSIIAYSPLAQGLLSGRFHADPRRTARPEGLRRHLPEFGRRNLERARPLVSELGRIAAAHGATAAQVALAWLLQFHGDLVVAIPGATRPGQVTESAAAMGLTLTRAELDRLDGASRRFA